MSDTMKNKAVYLDYNSTTPADPRVVKYMIPVFEEQFGNPSSENHETGRIARDLVENARSQVADIVNMRPADVIFTSGATESVNLALIGTMKNYKDQKDHLITCATEHKAVLDTVRHLEESGKKVTYLRVSESGMINLDELKSAITDRTVMISIMTANSETGVIHPIREIVQIAHARGILVHCDATQAIGKISFDAGALEVDMISFSSHKIYGPKGCGALVATRQARKQIRGILHGGGQENNLRSGTLNVPGIVGFGRACEIAAEEGLQDATRQEGLRDDFEKKLTESVPDVTINGGRSPRIPNTSSIRIAGALADAVIVNALGIEIATGSACSSSTMEPSHVLTAMGLSRTAADESVRVSIGRQTRQMDMDIALKEIAQSAKHIREVDQRKVEKIV